MIAPKTDRKSSSDCVMKNKCGFLAAVTVSPQIKKSNVSSEEKFDRKKSLEMHSDVKC